MSAFSTCTFSTRTLKGRFRNWDLKVPAGKKHATGLNKPQLHDTEFSDLNRSSFDRDRVLVERNDFL